MKLFNYVCCYHERQACGMMTSHINTLFLWLAEQDIMTDIVKIHNLLFPLLEIGI
jgi:hypothetical protein